MRLGIKQITSSLTVPLDVAAQQSALLVLEEGPERGLAWSIDIRLQGSGCG